ncbi:putative zinc-finger protein [Galdieria sulphuraria]|uniref:Putative zinc-finger protein n=1 Tax=Galdieria sulphuraria TaxID=130081 RepID=M2WQW7_GALSU|nr:putative zinc-finger protein [Galdieria sulphuraria]EME26200.1 putative zinc-finger protein [Galdieria sulphuraria]|eukprot:XP_005702720.1 putative zinc-finger protein [Galdieria sulphuraria]
MSNNSHALSGANVNFLFRSVERDFSNGKGLSETDKTLSETTHWRNTLNGTSTLQKHGMKPYNDIHEDWNERLRYTHSSNSLSSISEIVFQQDKRFTDDSSYLFSYPDHSLDYLSLSKHEDSKLGGTGSQQKIQNPFTSLVSTTPNSFGCNSANEIFSDWTLSSDSSETQASQASRVTLTSNLVNSEDNQLNSSYKYPIRRSRPDCIYYLKTGKCSYGTKCKYNHPPRDQTLVKALSRRECFDFLQFGRCPYGKKCKYSHPNRQHGEKNNFSTETTQHHHLAPKNASLKNSERHCQRSRSNLDLSMLELDEISSIWNEESWNKINFEDSSSTSYHLWDSISVFDPSLPNLVPDTAFCYVETMNASQMNERRRLFPDTCERHVVADVATEQHLPLRRPNHGSRRVSRDPSFLKDCVGNVSNVMKHPNQFFSTPSVELLEVNEVKFESVKKNMVAEQSQWVQDDGAEELCLGEETSDCLAALSSMFSSCSMQCSESN